jgi:tetratricopeptide (TPR) repeat protein
MRTKFFALIPWVILGCVLNPPGAGAAAGQQGEQELVAPDIPAPVLAPEPPRPQTPTPAALSPEERADIFMARKSYSDAVDYYRRALNATGRKDAGLWNKLGIAYQQLLDYPAARKAYKEATRRNPTFAEPWNNWGTTYYMANQAKKSLKYYRKALQLSPNNASFHLNLGSSLYQIKKYPQAVEEYRLALSLDPTILTEHSPVGTIIKARTADAKFFFYMAKVFASLGRAEEAVRYLRRAFEDGFNDQKLLDEDPDFKKISEFPAYVELRKTPPKAIKD